MKSFLIRKLFDTGISKNTQGYGSRANSGIDGQKKIKCGELKRK